MTMIVTTTNGVEGRRVTDYLGVVHGSAVMGSNLFRDFFAGVRDIVGGRVASYETVLTDAKDAALGAWATVIADDSIGGDNKTILMVSATGTAVRLS